jgi:hypothetical protein
MQAKALARLVSNYISEVDETRDYELNPVLLDLRLLFPVFTNHLYRKVGNLMLLSAEGRVFKKDVISQIHIAYRENFVIPYHVPLGIHIEVYSPANYINRFDWDGCPKALQDAIFEAQRLEPAEAGKRPLKATDTWIRHAIVDKFAMVGEEEENHPDGYSRVKLWVL